MAEFEVVITAYTSDSITFEFDGDIDDIDEDVIRQNWDCLPLTNGYTTDWDNVEFEVTMIDEDN